MTTVNCTVFKETEKAYMLRVNGSTDCFWIPKFVVDKNNLKVHSGKIKMPEDLLTKYNTKSSYKPTKKEETKEETKPTAFDVAVDAAVAQADVVVASDAQAQTQTADVVADVAQNTTKKEEAVIKVVDKIFDDRTTAEEEAFDEAFDEEAEAGRAYINAKSSEKEAAWNRYDAAQKNVGIAGELLSKKQEQVARYQQICEALEDAIWEAKEAGAKNKNAFSCNVFFDEDGKVEGAKVTFKEDANMCVMYKKNTYNETVKALYHQNYFTYETNHEEELALVASTILELYDTNKWNYTTHAQKN